MRSIRSLIRAKTAAASAAQKFQAKNCFRNKRHMLLRFDIAGAVVLLALIMCIQKSMPGQQILLVTQGIIPSTVSVTVIQSIHGHQSPANQRCDAAGVLAGMHVS